jgi:putative transposase
MARVRYAAEQNIGKLREVEVLLAKGSTEAQACKQIEVAEQT